MIRSNPVQFALSPPVDVHGFECKNQMVNATFEGIEEERYFTCCCSEILQLLMTEIVQWPLQVKLLIYM